MASDERKSSCFTKSNDGSKTLASEGFLTSGQRSRRNQRFGTRPNVPASFNRLKGQIVAPRARFELATFRLTAERSTVELPGSSLRLQWQPNREKCRRATRRSQRGFGLTTEGSVSRNRARSSSRKSQGRAVDTEPRAQVTDAAAARGLFPCPTSPVPAQERQCPGEAPRPNDRAGIGRRKTRPLSAGTENPAARLLAGWAVSPCRKMQFTHLAAVVKSPRRVNRYCAFAATELPISRVIFAVCDLAAGTSVSAYSAPQLFASSRVSSSWPAPRRARHLPRSEAELYSPTYPTRRPGHPGLHPRSGGVCP